MKQMTTLLAVLLLVGCGSTSGPPAPRVEQIPVPVPYCPAPPEYMSQLPKNGGFDALTEDSLPGDVAKQWHYEVEYWKGIANIQRAIIESYQKNSTNLEQFEKDVQRLIDETNSRLKESQPLPQ